MSVYYQARLDGRLTDAAIREAGGSPRRALQRVKRLEAYERHRATPYRRTAACRRERAARA